MYSFRVFLPSFEKERRKMLAKRRKKDRGSTERLTENPRVTHSVRSDFGMLCTKNAKISLLFVGEGLAPPERSKKYIFYAL